MHNVCTLFPYLELSVLHTSVMKRNVSLINEINAICISKRKIIASKCSAIHNIEELIEIPALEIRMKGIN